jgi:murein DD-endopeptidase MepM/ murein hydrolase activator NlpD
MQINKLTERIRIVLKRLFPSRRQLIIRTGSFAALLILVWIAANINWVLIFRGYPEPEPAKPAQVRYEFEIPVDSFVKETDRVRSNQFLSEILTPRGISLALIDRIAKDFRHVFDVRTMKSGNRIHFYYSPDTMHQLQYMVYEKSAAQYVVYNFRDSLDVTLKQKEIRTEVQYIEGVIETNIWDAIVGQGLPIGLVDEITDVYAWMIDAFSINRGDRFEAIFENQLVDSVSIGVGNVLAAKFIYGKKLFEAYQFEQNGVTGYFDAKGESLKRAFLRAPLVYRAITSRFSGSRMHPILRIRRPHYGVDYSAPSGTPVVSIGDGKVVMKGWDRGGGNTLKIKHNGTYTSGYMHLSGYARGIAPGVTVQQGQVIGYVGSTGLATGPHLDFRIWQNGKPVDPLRIEAPPVEPIELKNKPAFDSIVHYYRKDFDRFKAGFTATVDTF